jgi:cytochrome c551/c552
MKKLLRISLFIIFSLGLVHAVSAEEGEIDAPRLYKKKCRKCHDRDGSGTTPAGKKLKVKDYSTAEDQAKFTDEEAAKAIREGVKDDAGKELMEAYPDYTDEEIKALVVLIRSFAPAE